LTRQPSESMALLLVHRGNRLILYEPPSASSLNGRPTLNSRVVRLNDEIGHRLILRSEAGLLLSSFDVRKSQCAIWHWLLFL
jgi:hypothetical protein